MPVAHQRERLAESSVMNEDMDAVSARAVTAAERKKKSSAAAATMASAKPSTSTKASASPAALSSEVILELLAKG